MSKTLFKLAAGIHVDLNGRKYVKGDIIESITDLSATFPNKFLNVGPAQEPAKTPKKSAPAASGDTDPSDEADEAESTPSGSLGEDVTEDFPTAGDKYKVFKKGKNHFVAAVGEPDEALHEEPMTAKQVAPFIKSL